MTEEDLSALVTSIDENDIIIIPSNDSENDENIDVVPDHFTISHQSVHINPSIPTSQTRSFIRQDSNEEFEDETFMERLYGLTEMFPNWFIRFYQNSYQYSKYIGQFLKKSIWFCSSSFIILILPILVQLEFSQVNEMQAAQTREILLGPTAQIGIGQK